MRIEGAKHAVYHGIFEFVFVFWLDEIGDDEVEDGFGRAIGTRQRSCLAQIEVARLRADADLDGGRFVVDAHVEMRDDFGYHILECIDGVGGHLLPIDAGWLDVSGV